MTPGTYAGGVSVTANGVPNSPQTISVSLTVSATVQQLSGKNSASFAAGSLAPNTIGFTDAVGVIPSLLVAPDGPWPTSLGGVSLEITDSQGQKRLAPIYFAAPTSISYLVPAATALGHATTKLTTSTGATISGTLEIQSVSPGLYSANSTGSGVAAGLFIRVAGGGAQTTDLLFDPTNRNPVAIDLGPASDQVYCSLYGTGFRGAGTVTATAGGLSVPALGFAAVTQYQGLDVVNIGRYPDLWQDAER